MIKWTNFDEISWNDQSHVIIHSVFPLLNNAGNYSKKVGWAPPRTKSLSSARAQVPLIFHICKTNKNIQTKQTKQQTNKTTTNC